MNKRGFTLTELIGVIIILSVIAMLVFPITTRILKDNKEKLYKEQIASLESIARTWVSKNYEKIEGLECLITPKLLEQEGYIKEDNAIDPRTGNKLAGGFVVSWNESKNQYTYTYEENYSGMECG